ncbi:hypothetical protein [Achromobacter pestifer]|uniref:Uncharacterized protein n=1 Tax=Achromobacter pestifer TaxID=1353889 RepID=A0A6S6YVE3_9BURK|nr:hypothetical protein [Achromobacter pestifer]CAB3648298.1 hypothetical protein LMG3431_02647 [Achromobacter pestifer]
MSLAPTSAPLSVAQARADSVGYLALIYADKRLPLQVRQSAAGHYIGTADNDGPVSRESIEYFRSLQAADRALANGRWKQRTHP